ncbi:MAG: glutamate-5-semialdehyde dehydrogenase, partial [Actinomycetes bacterium]
MAIELASLGVRARAAVRSIATASSAARDQALKVAADLLITGSTALLEANRTDLDRAHADGLSEAALDRLALDAGRIESMAAGLRGVAILADPVGEVVDGWVRPNGLAVERVRVPLGVVGIIYENRPNVTSDAAGLCLKSGNVAFLRGSSSAIESNRAIVAILRQALAKAGLAEDGVLLVEDTSHQTAR